MIMIDLLREILSPLKQCLQMNGTASTEPESREFNGVHIPASRAFF
jgi:hypothetical protein